MDPDPTPLILLSGPTGTGKSDLAIEIARRLDGEIINADSVQIYRGLDIGSAKPSLAQRATVPHLLYDALEPDEHLDVARWTALADEAIGLVRSRGRTPVVVGGTNFYIRALLRGLPELPPRQPEIRERLERILGRPRGTAHLHRLLRSFDPPAAARIDGNDRHRIERAIEVYAATGRPISSFRAPSPDDPARYDYQQFALTLPRAELTERLDARVEHMFASGLVEEARALLSRFPATIPPLQTIGYKEAVAVAQDRLSSREAIEETKRRTRAYAKRQMTWLRAERDVQWLLAAESPASLAETVLAALDDRPSEPRSRPRIDR